MRLIRLYGILILLTSLVEPATAQNFEWLKTYGSKSQGSIWGNSADQNGGCTFIYSTFSGNTNDTIKFDKFKFKITSGESENYLVQLDSTGKVLKAKCIGIFSSWYVGMTRDTFGNYYVSGYITSNNSRIDSVSIDLKNGRVIFAKFDTNLNLRWYTQTGNSLQVYGNHLTNLAVLDNKLYFTCVSKDTTKIGKDVYFLDPNGNTSIYGELDLKAGNIKWSNYFYSPKLNSAFTINSMVKLKDKLYFAGELTDFYLNIGNDTFYGPGGFVIQTDTVGNYKKRLNLYNRQYFKMNSITTDGSQLFIAGVFKDSLKWGNKKIAPSYRTGSFPNSFKNSELFAASLSLSLQPGWFFHPKVYDTTQYGGSWLTSVKYTGGYLYFGGMLRGSIIIDSNILSSTYADPIIFKSDLRGNILWATQGNTPKFGSSGAYLNNIEALPDRSVFAVGFYINKIQFGKFKDSLGQKGYVVKITDYSITRGKVKIGPYCAGDTIKVPYTLIGNFDTSNYFIAELSNEFGNFEGNQRELGRLKTNRKGTINGNLPLFQVASSPYYRIRIRSTKPAIQSYYVYDTLRLLIYSKDKATPGPPETICMGDSIKLNTYGGTKWTWSPKYRMDDSAKRQPWAWPIKDTIYKIIIADSSGCGKPDTAFKTIKVRAYPKAKLTFNDTLICDNSNLKVPVLFEGGDSNYTWRWYFVASPKLWFPSNSGNGKFADTFSFSPTVSKVAIILKDGCTSKADTAYLTISQRKPVTIKTSYHDTTLCTGNVLNYKATATGGIPKQYRYQWKDLVTNSVLSTTDSLKILTKKALKIQLILNDGCEALGDTAMFEVKVRAELKALTNLRDTTICEGKSLNYTAQATGGNSKTYIYSWVLNGKEISTSNFLNLTSNILNLTSNLSLITKDNCSPNDTIKKTITVLPSPKADFTWDLACSRTVTKFKFTGTKPNSPITTTFHWNFNNEASSNLENPSHRFAKSGTSTSVLTLTSNNGCTDTLNKKIEVKVQAKAEFEVKDVCENQTALFTNQSQDATSYLWKFGDGQTSQQENPKHNYTISTTTTYNVTLVAQVTGGCADSISKALTINQNPSSDFSYTYNGNKVDLKITKGGNSYQWKFGTTDSAKTTATTYTHTIKSSDQHTVCLTATDLSGCSSQTCKNVTVGILKLTEKNFKIFPNPNNGSFTIELENPEMDAAIEVYDVMGKLVKKWKGLKK